MVARKRLLSRRGFLGGGLGFLVPPLLVGRTAASAQIGGAAGDGAGPPAQPTTGTTSRPLVFQMHWCPQAQFAGYLMALEKGFFRNEGLTNLTLRWSSTGDRPFDRLAQGAVDFCTGWLADALVAKARGSNLVQLAQVVQQSSLMLVAWRGSGIAAPRDFTGKRVALWGDNFDVQALAFFRKYHARPIIVPQSTSMVPFLRKAVDGASAMYYNEYHKLIEAGVRPEELRVFRFADYGLMFPEDGIYCTGRTRQRQAGLCAGLVRACRQGWDYALAHEAETLDVVMDNCRAANVRTNRNHQRWMLRSIRDAILVPPPQKPVPWGTLSKEVYEHVVRLLADQGLIGRPPAFREFRQPPITTAGAQE